MNAPQPEKTRPTAAERAAELALIRRAQGDESGPDHGAFEELMRRYHRLVYKIAFGKTHDRDDADDLCQEIFLHAFRSIRSLRDPQAFVGWLMSIAHNRGNRFCRTKIRKIVGLEEGRQELVERAKLRAEGNSEDSSGVDEWVRSLPTEYRLCLTWKYVEGRSYEEIGERLSMSFNQVDYLLRKAKRALRQTVERAARGSEQEGKGS